MKKMVVIACLLTLAAAPLQAAEKPSVAAGKKLFASTELGTSGMTCEGCHPGGQGLEKAATYEEKKLGKIVNTCITKPLKGKELAAGSAELKSLVMYIKSLGKADKK
jgi:hypothetical protein